MARWFTTNTWPPDAWARPAAAISRDAKCCVPASWADDSTISVACAPSSESRFNWPADTRNVAAAAWATAPPNVSPPPPIFVRLPNAPSEKAEAVPTSIVCPSGTSSRAGCVKAGSVEPSWISDVPAGSEKTIVGVAPVTALAPRIACRSEPAPASAVVVTSSVSGDGSSSSVIVPIASGSTRFAPDALTSFSLNVSFGSSSVSPRTGTLIVLTVSPSRNVTVPVVAL